MGKAKRARQRGIQRRTALSARNIVEFSMAESAKVQKRNRNMKTDALKTAPELLGRVIFVSAEKEQGK